jgi:hypothetical protein
MRGDAFAVEAQASTLGQNDKAVMLKLLKAAGCGVLVDVDFFGRDPNRQVKLAVVLGLMP